MPLVYIIHKQMLLIYIVHTVILQGSSRKYLIKTLAFGKNGKSQYEQSISKAFVYENIYIRGIFSLVLFKNLLKFSKQF